MIGGRDLGGDGQVSDSEFGDAVSEKDLGSEFEAFDGNGFLSARELRHVLTATGEQFTSGEAGDMISERGVDVDGHVDPSHG